MESIVLNNSLGSKYEFANPVLTSSEETSILADLFEQLLIFDKITLTTSRLNFALTFLLSKIGINSVERLLEAGYLNFILWSPIIVTSTGIKRPDGTFDDSVIYGQPPIVAGSLGDRDLDPEKNVKAALAHFSLHRDRIRSFTRKAIKHYTIPDGMVHSTDAAKLVIDAYKNNNLESLGLPYSKEPNQLNVEERGKLLDLGHKVTETGILIQYGLKSYENYEPYAICKKNIENIGKGYNISANTTNLFILENLPNLKELFKIERLDFDSVFKLRHGSTSKYYRNWINSIGENSNLKEVSEAYLNEIKGNGKFFETTQGKFLKNLGLFGVNSAVGSAIAGTSGLIAGYTLGLLESFWLDTLLKGKNPSMFIDDVREEIAPPATLDSDKLR